MRRSPASLGANPAHEEEEQGGDRRRHRKPHRRHRHLNEAQTLAIAHRLSPSVVLLASLVQLD